jgi:hypothetical protein
VDWGTKLLFDFVNIVPIFPFRFNVDFFGKIGACCCWAFSSNRANFWRFRCSIIITQTR